MSKTLVKKSDFLKVKYKFFINRLLIYFSFLLIPIWLQQTEALNFFAQSTILVMYMIFMSGQWYLLGKEIDHRLKIYYKVNSSMERIAYRVFVGNIVMLLLFNIFSLFPSSILFYIFWGFFALLGLFYSWPTRGKIIEDSMTDQFGELRFLDSFEKTVFILSVIIFFVSLPELPLFENIDALKLYFDPQEKVNAVLWNYLSVLYYPFVKYPKLYNLIWSFHFYFIGLGLFFLVLYALLRHFFSRRLSILGVFSVVSSWSLPRILVDDYFYSISSTISIVWAWAMMWSLRSGTYRSGFFTSLICFYLAIINVHNVILLPITIALFYFYFLKDQTKWYKLQWLKYNVLGAFFCLLVLLFSTGAFESIILSQFKLLSTNISDLIYRKAFFTISPIGLVMGVYIFYRSYSKQEIYQLNINLIKPIEFGFLIISILAVGLFINPDFISGFSTIWILSFFALIPLEWIFQSISRLRSKRNLIYVLYILVCILDSHLENRIRIIAKMFLNDDYLNYLIRY